MKKVVTILFVLFSLKGFSQYPIQQNLGSPTTLVNIPANGGLRGGLITLSFTDTIAANLTNIKFYDGAIIKTTSPIIAMWYRDLAHTIWMQILPSGGTTGLGAWLTTRNLNIPTDISNNGYFGTIAANGIGHYTNNTLRFTEPAGNINDNATPSVKYLAVDTTAGGQRYLVYAPTPSTVTPISSLTAATAGNAINNGAFTQDWQWNSLTSNIGLSLSSGASTASSNGQTVLSVQNVGANGTSGQTTYAAKIFNNKTGTSSTNNALWLDANGGTTNNALFINRGKIVAPLPNGSTTDSIVTWNSTSKIFGAISPSSIVTPPPISSLTSATGTNNIDNADFGQTWAWNSLTGNGLTLSSNSTMGVASALFTSSLSGANDNPSVTGYAGIFSNTRTGTTSTNYGLKVTATGATNNYALQLVDGSQGAGKILQSDANGNTVWVAQSSIVGAVPTLQQVTTAGNTTSLGITVQSLTVGRGGGGGLTNTAFGISALASNTSGSENTSVGSNALASVTTGAKNTSVGSTALSVTTGSGNTGIGAYAGAYNTTGSNQYFINSIDRNNYLGDTTKSPIWILQNSTVSSQRIKVNGLLQINDGTQGSGKLFTSDADGLGTWVTALPNGTTATTQTAGDNSTKVATTAYVATAVAAGGGVTGSGTTNSVARWTSSSALGTGIITDNNAIMGITPTVSTGTTTSSGISVVANSLTSGTAMNVSSSSATTGALMNLSNSNGSSTGTPLTINTATGFVGNAMDYQLNAISRFSVNQIGSVTSGGRMTVGAVSGGSSIGLYIANAGTTKWSIRNDAGTTGDGLSIIDGGGNVRMEISQTTGFTVFGTNGTPNSTLQDNGSFATAYIAKTGTYTATASDYTITGDASGGNFQITLPTAIGVTGRIYVIKTISTGTVTIGCTGGQNIDGSATKSLNVQYTGYTLQSNGSNWFIIGSF